jgi:hypothetical protein
MEKTGAMYPTAFNNTVNLIIALITAYPCDPSLRKSASRGLNRPAESSNVKTFVFFRPIALSVERYGSACSRPLRRSMVAQEQEEYTRGCRRGNQ